MANCMKLRDIMRLEETQRAIYQKRAHEEMTRILLTHRFRVMNEFHVIAVWRRGKDGDDPQQKCYSDGVLLLQRMS